MSFDFTPEQQAAIDRREGPLLLAANAGSGKTSVLVERYVAMVMQDGIAPSAILAVTFTDRAAGEMRGRIRKLLVERGGHEHVAAAEAAWISTLHGFCTRLLRQHAVAVGIDPAFRLLGDGESRELRDRAFEQALAQFMAGGIGSSPDVGREPSARPTEARSQANVELAAAFTTDGLATEIAGVYDLLRTRGEREPRLPAIDRLFAPDIGAIRETVGPAIAHLADAGDGQTVQQALAAAERVEELVADDHPSLDQLSKCVVKRKVKAFDAEPYARYREALEHYLQVMRDIAGDAALIQLDALLASFARHYETAKRAAGAVDFADLELLTRDLLAHNEGLRESYRSRFERVMVDEFQDINPLQLELLELLDGGHTFVVGDEFQSIYGFRHADVGVFRDRRAQLAEHDAALVLGDNFRSHPDLLGALNEIFADRFGERFERLSRGQTDTEREAPRLEVLITDRDWDADDDERDLRWRGPEARLIAARVDALISSEFRPRDIAVLVRAASDMHIYERALELRGIPTLASGGRGFWARRQIRDLLAFLSSLANPRDEVEFFALLASPLAGISSTGLVQIADAAPAGYRWDAIARDDEKLGVLGSPDHEALEHFRAWFEPLRQRTAQMSLASLIDHAITTAGYDVHVLSLPAGRRRLANLFKLQRLATQFEEVHGRDIRGFVDRARAELEAEAREPDAPIELGDADAVQLMTMHAAKGLEFPVVVCADLGRQPMSRRGRLLIDGERIGLRLPSLRGDPQNTLDYDALCEESKARDAAEEDRVLYVALTRAMELLIVSGGERLAPWPVAQANCPPIRWIAPGMVPGLQDHLDVPFADLTGHAGARVALAVLTADRADEMLSLPGQDPQATLKIHTGPPPPAAVDVALPRLPAPGVPDRISYSSVSSYGKCGYQHYLRRVLRMPEVDPGELARQDVPPSGMDPRARGSIVHELLEALDFADPQLPAESEVRALAELMETEIDDVGVTECLALVSAFIDGPLAPKLRSASRVERERGFTFSLEMPEEISAPLVNGFVDVIAHLPDGAALIIDYKTDQVEEGTDLERIVAADYGVQRAIYALAALRGGAPTVDVIHLFLNHPEEPATARFSKSDIPALQDEVRRHAAGLLAGDFTPTDTPHRDLCARCPGRTALCSYGPEMTERELPA